MNDPAKNAQILRVTRYPKSVKEIAELTGLVERTTRYLVRDLVDTGFMVEIPDKWPKLFVKVVKDFQPKGVNNVANVKQAMAELPTPKDVMVVKQIHEILLGQDKTDNPILEELRLAVAHIESGESTLDYPALINFLMEVTTAIQIINKKRN